MGATVLVDTRVAAFRSAAGNTIYTIWESTYEKNVFPHNPHWSCTALGGIEIALQRIFAVAASCDSGSTLSQSNRDIDPTALIKKWLGQLQNPFQFNDFPVDLAVGKDFEKPIPPDKLPHMIQVCADMSRQDIQSALETGSAISLSLFENAEVLSAMFDWKVIGPWRIFRRELLPTSGKASQDLCYSPVPSMSGHDWEPPICYRIGRFGSISQTENGSWSGSAANVDGSNLISQMWRHELSSPGCYEPRLKAIATARRSIQDIPAGAIAFLDVRDTQAFDGYIGNLISELTTRFPTTEGVTKIAISDAYVELTNKLGYIPESLVSWSIPVQSSSPAMSQMSLV